MTLKHGNGKEQAAFLVTILFFQLLVDIVAVLNVPIARQILSIIYLTLLPGMLLLRMLGIQGLDTTEKLLFSIGLSIAFAMFLGLILNQVGLSFNLPYVLTAPILLLVMNCAVSFLCVASYFLKSKIELKFERSSFSLLSVLTICFPVLAILGTAFVNFNGDSVILLLMIGLIAVTVLISSFRDRSNCLPLILSMITIAVLMQTSLVSDYIVGYDVSVAHHVSKITLEDGIWNPIIPETDIITLRTNQMLSTTVFPTIYSNMLNLDVTWIFKIIYPLIFALVPVALYKLYRKYTKRNVSFVAAFFILADITFFIEMPGLPSQMISEFFLVLLLTLMFNEEISSPKKMILFTIFSAGIIVSHYGISYVFMFLVSFVWLICFLLKKPCKIKLSYVTFFCVLAFAWYIYTTKSASFNSLVEMGQNIYTNFWSDLLNPQSRQELALLAIGAGEQAVSIGHWLGRGLHYLSQFFIVLGLIFVVLRQKKLYKFDLEYIIMSVFMMSFALLPLAAPSFNLLNVTRMYHISLLFLAPFCIIGGNSFFSLIPALRKSIVPFLLTVILLVSLFLFETGFIYEVTGDVSYSVPLSMHRMNRAMFYGNGYLTECLDVFGAEWLHSNIILTPTTIVYADRISIFKPLRAYAVFPLDHTETLSNVTSFSKNAYVYLRNFNTLNGKIYGEGYEFGRVWNTSDINPRLEEFDKIYANGGSEIFFVLNKTDQ